MNDSVKYLENLPDLVQGAVEDSIISRAIHQAGDYRAVLFRFAAGQQLSEHTAARPAVLIFLEGQADLTLGTESYSASAGTYVHMPANFPHSVQARTDLLMLLELLPQDKEPAG
jgi:quercetin dioxygenase-like cupin family protein